MFWTYHLSLDYPLFFALAIIDMEKDKMIDPDFDLSDIIAVSNLLLITYYCFSLAHQWFIKEHVFGPTSSMC